ncbi:AIM24 family protein [Nocardioides sp. WS12]|uniref:AIM24 family protein n=1 Tax=Nocardioides sp. WS12 TaxID=2486272 RepID=UPI0015FAFC61|nr:AIM24 family protein [Nocardioides sp. WS12]
MTAAAWHPDPTGRHELRYWDGSQWTDHVSDQGVQSTSPVNAPADAGAAQGDSSDSGSVSSESMGESMGESTGDSMSAEPVAEQPAADQWAAQSAEPVAEQPMATQQMAAQPDPAQQWAAQQAQPVQAQPVGQPMGGQPVGQPMNGQPYGDAFAGITGELIDGRFSEKDGVGASLQNKRMLRVRVVEPFMAKQGAMVAYQGNVGFNYQGGGAAKFLKKAFTGEGLSLMRVEGQGDVFLADGGHEVHILHLNNSGLSVSGTNVLAFSATLDWNVERVKGGSIAAGGLFNTTLRGTGWVAITTDGQPVVLNAAEAPTFADAQALVAWSVHLQTSIKSSFTAGALIGRGSGEAFQVAFSGQGFVIVQPSEGGVVPPHTH